MRTRRNVEGDFLEVRAHSFTVAPGHNDAGGPFGKAQDTLAFCGAERTKQPGGGPPLILGR